MTVTVLSLLAVVVSATVLRWSAGVLERLPGASGPLGEVTERTARLRIRCDEVAAAVDGRTDR